MLQCRGCLSEGAMIPFEENTIKHFNLLTNLNVQPLDVMPQQLCECCHEMVNLFKDFREKCLLSNSILYNNICDEIIKDDNTSFCKIIKTEKKEIDFEFEDKEENSGVDDNFIYELMETEDLKQISAPIKEEAMTKRPTAFVDQHNSKRIKCKKKSSNLSCEKTNSKGDPQKFKKPKHKNKSLSTVSCGLCTKIVNETKLVEHLEGHKTSLNCQICLLNFTEWSQMLTHRLKHLPEEEKRCHICFKRYLTPASLEYHYRKLHCNEENPILKCVHCAKCYDFPLKLTKHVLETHSEKTFICDYCSKVFNNKDGIRTHMLAHTDRKPYKCDQCDYACKLSCNLRAHRLRRHTVTNIKCKKCFMVFVKQERLDAHVCKVVSRVCPTCGKSVRGNRLKRHMLSHATTGQFACERCDAVYRSRGGLRTHRLMHDGVRAHTCDLCPAAFYYRSVLIKHRRTHTGIKPYVCKVCSKAFTGNNNLKVHMRVHGEYLITKKNVTEEKIKHRKKRC